MSTDKKIFLSTEYTGEATPPHQIFVTDAEGNNVWEDKPEIATDEDIFEMLQELDAFPVVMDESGAIMTDEDGSILLI